MKLVELAVILTVVLAVVLAVELVKLAKTCVKTSEHTGRCEEHNDQFEKIKRICIKFYTLYNNGEATKTENSQY